MWDFYSIALNWLNAENEVIGVPAQNWMLILGAGLLIYIAAVVIADRRQPRIR
jgi:hypothetical protein